MQGGLQPASYVYKTFMQKTPPPCTSSPLTMSTTLTSNVWERLPDSTRELMEDAISFMGSELEPEESCVQQRLTPGQGAGLYASASLPGGLPSAAASASLPGGLLGHVGSPSQSRRACIFCPPKTGTERSKISANDATAIFQARSPHAGTARHPTLGEDLARQYGITSKAVRDIWALRTWRAVTRPFWNAADHRKIRKRFPNIQACARCRESGASTGVGQW